MKAIIRPLLSLLVFAGMVMSAGNVFAVEFQEGKGTFSVVVQIKTDQAESNDYIPKIKTAFEDASNYLWTATKKQHRFGKVIILIPDHWADKPEYLPAKGEQYDVLIGDSISWCTAPGNKIHIASNKCLRPRTIVHEWGHAIYTLGDEYTLWTSKEIDGKKYFGWSFKDDLGNWRRCSEANTFVTSKDFKKVKVYNAAEGKWENVVDNYTVTNAAVANGVTSSIMWFHHKAPIVDFCDRDTHTSLKNTAQDKQHNGSCWDTMEGMYELKYYSGTTTGIDYEPVVFELKKSAGPANIVICTDRSGSMEKFNKLPLAKAAASAFIDLTEDDYLGLTSFSDTATGDASLQQITNNTERDALKAIINGYVADGDTTIGGGLLASQQELDANAVSSLINVIILLSDGAENTPPSIDSVLPDIISKKTTVYTIGIGTEHNIASLYDIATQTNGTYYYAKDASLLNEIYEKIRSAVGHDSIAAATGSASAPMAESEEVALMVDAYMDQATFMFAVEDSDDLVFSLETPTGGVVDQDTPLTDQDVEYLEGSNYAIFRINEPEIGDWKAIVQNNSSGNADFSVSLSGRSPIQVKAEMDYVPWSEDPLQYRYLHIKCMPQQDGEPIIDLNVRAFVTYPYLGGTIDSDFALKDDGSNGDLVPYDGVYEGYFTRLAYDDVVHSIKVEVDNHDLNGQVGTYFGSPPDIGEEFSMSENLKPINDDFFRQIGLSSLYTREYPSTGYDITPPGKITTLAAVKSEGSSIKLNWMAPGDDLYDGTAYMYLIRMSNEPITDENYWDAALVPGEPDLPSESGTWEEFTVTGIEKGKYYYFVIQSKDDYFNYSVISNVVVTGIQGDDDDDDNDSGGDDDNDDNNDENGCCGC